MTGGEQASNGAAHGVRHEDKGLSERELIGEHRKVISKVAAGSPETCPFTLFAACPVIGEGLRFLGDLRLNGVPGPGKILQASFKNDCRAAPTRLEHKHTAP